MPLTDAQRHHFKEHGYVAVPDFYSQDEVAAMRADLERLQKEGRLRNVATDGDGVTHSQTLQNLQLCPISPHSSLFRAMPFDPKVIEAVGQLIGEPVLLHLDQVFLKPGRHGTGTNWHQDNAYFKVENPLMGTAMWTAVHEATVENGTLNVVPGSFREVYEHRRDPYSDHHIRCWPPEERAVAVELPAGGVVFFAYGTAHCTRANNTDRERAGVALHFLNEKADQNAQRGFAQEARPTLSGPNATGGTREYGVKIEGTWPQEVARALGQAAERRIER